MIQHCVFCQLAEEHDPAELGAVMAGLDALVGAIAGFTAFAHGPNIDLEAKSPDHGYGFVGSFAGRAALETYLGDPRHMALGNRLVALCRGGGAGIVVYDLQVTG